jgi:hypothetical protein
VSAERLDSGADDSETAALGAAASEPPAPEDWTAWLDEVELALSSDGPVALPEPAGLGGLPAELAARAAAVRERIDARAAELRRDRDGTAAELARLGAAGAAASSAPRPAYLDATA